MVVMLSERRVELEGVGVGELECAVLFQVGELALERPVHPATASPSDYRRESVALDSELERRVSPSIRSCFRASRLSLYTHSRGHEHESRAVREDVVSKHARQPPARTPSVPFSLSLPLADHPQLTLHLRVSTRQPNSSA